MRIFKKIFIFSLLTAFVVMFVTQVLLKNSYAKKILSRLYEMESQYVYSEQELKSGYIVINVSNPSDNLYLMENGEKTMKLNTRTAKITVSDNSVIEIDGIDCETQCNIQISDISENLDGFFEDKINVSSNIVILGRFFVK